jgi:hypothetical protein
MKVTACHSPLSGMFQETERQVIRLDFIPDREFHGIFMRVSAHIDLRGAFTPEEVNARILSAAKAYKSLAKSGYMSAKYAYRHAGNLEKLVYTAGSTNFGTRAISTARRHPYGIENLTLNYGHGKAVDILLERNASLRRMTRIVEKREAKATEPLMERFRRTHQRRR